MVKCAIKVKSADGKVEQYQGVFPSTVDAVLDAMERYGVGVKVTVCPL